MAKEVQTVTMTPIRLEWSEWHAWEHLKADARGPGGSLGIVLGRPFPDARGYLEIG